jgi:hypothetical protein
MDQDFKSAWESAYFCSLAHHSPTHELVVDLAEKKGWKIHAEVEEVCPVITLADSWDDYLAGPLILRFFLMVLLPTYPGVFAVLWNYRPISVLMQQIPVSSNER